MAPGRRARALRIRTAGLLAALALVAVGLVTLTPGRVDRSLAPYLESVLVRLHSHGVPAFVDYASVEFSANIVLFLPIGFLGALLLARSRWWWSIAVGFAMSATVETVQGLFLPSRVASLGDVAANTLGAAVGALGALLLRVVIAHRDRLVLADAVDARVIAAPEPVPPGLAAPQPIGTLR